MAYMSERPMPLILHTFRRQALSLITFSGLGMKVQDAGPEL